MQINHNGKSTGLPLSINGLVGQYRRFTQCSYLLCALTY